MSVIGNETFTKAVVFSRMNLGFSIELSVPAIKLSLKAAVNPSAQFNLMDYLFL